MMFTRTLLAGLAAAVLASGGIDAAEAKTKPVMVAPPASVVLDGLDTVSATELPARHMYNGVAYCRDTATGRYLASCAPPPPPEVRRKHIAPPAHGVPRAAHPHVRPVAAAIPRTTRAHNAACASRYRSYNPKTGFYVGSGGQLKVCRAGAKSRGGASAHKAPKRLRSRH